jgi:hypothetical protein
VSNFLKEADELGEIMRESARDIGRNLKAGQDWMPVAAFMSPHPQEHGKFSVEVVGFGPEYLENAAGKDAMREQMAAWARRTGSVAACLVLSCWHTSIDLEDTAALDRADRKGLRDVDGREEWLLVQVIEAKQNQIWKAPITRMPGCAPELGSFTLYYESGTGRPPLRDLFMQAIQGQLKSLQ